MFAKSTETFQNHEVSLSQSPLKYNGPEVLLVNQILWWRFLSRERNQISDIICCYILIALNTASLLSVLPYCLPIQPLLVGSHLHNLPVYIIKATLLQHSHNLDMLLLSVMRGLIVSESVYESPLLLAAVHSAVMQLHKISPNCLTNSVRIHTGGSSGVVISYIFRIFFTRY